MLRNDMLESPNENQNVVDLFAPSQNLSANNNINRLFEELDTNIKDFVLRSYDVLQTEPTRLKLLEVALGYLRTAETMRQTDDLLLDFFLTINSVYRICVESYNLKSSIEEFLAARENQLRGDSHDYCYNWSLANQFCADVVQVIFPKEASPLNILLQQARTQDRTAPWQDLTTLDEDIEAPEDFFRTKNNAIHLYEAVIGRAIDHLKGGHNQIDHIWFGTDLKETGPLDMESLTILKQRSKTLNELINYSAQLGSSKENVFERFNALREGFHKGTYGHGRINLGASLHHAGPSAFKAHKEFFDWWNSLDTTMEGKQLREKINALPGVENFITNLEKSNDYCVYGKQLELDTVLRNSKVQDELRKTGTNHDYLTQTQLDEMRKKILEELKEFKTIKTNQSMFDVLRQSKPFMQYCLQNPSEVSFNNLGKLIASFQISLTATRVEKQTPAMTVTNGQGALGLPDYSNFPYLQVPAEKKQHKNHNSFFKHAKEKVEEVKQKISRSKEPKMFF